MKQQNKGPHSLNDKLALFQEKFGQYAQLNGPDSLNSKPIQRARRDSINDMLRGHKLKDLSLEDRITYRMLRGQAQSLNKAIYKNRLIRYPRNIIVGVARGVAKLRDRWLDNRAAKAQNQDAKTQLNRIVHPVAVSAARNAAYQAKKAATDTAKLKIQTSRHTNKPRVRKPQGKTQGLHM